MIEARRKLFLYRNNLMDKDSPHQAIIIRVTLGTALPLVSEARAHADEEVHASVTAPHASEGLSPPKVKIAPA